MSFKYGSVSKYKNSSVDEKKEEWSTGLELDTLLENATSECGLNEDMKVQDQNSKEKARKHKKLV